MRISCGTLGISRTLHLACTRGCRGQVFYWSTDCKSQTHTSLQGRPNRQRHAQQRDGHIPRHNAAEPAKARDGKRRLSRYGIRYCASFLAIMSGEAAKTRTMIRCMTLPPKLDLEDRYRADIAFVRIALGKNRTHSGNGKPYSYMLACVHGAGGGGACPWGMVNRARGS